MSVHLSPPPPIGSYPPDDVTFLLKDLSHVQLEQDIDGRELEMQGTGHYSETLPIEYRPTERYRATFEALLSAHADETALLVCTLADVLIRAKGHDLVLVSLARAGTPVGVLLRRAIQARHGLAVPHYSVSIIRDRGIDLVAMRYILSRHAAAGVQFVDGWTGKGTIGDELIASVTELQRDGGPGLDPELAVLADPAHSTTRFATREDALIPSACLNATVAGLISRTVLNDAWIGPGDFHGAKWYRELADDDVSQRFVETIAARFDAVAGAVPAQLAAAAAAPAPDRAGRAFAEAVQTELGLRSPNLIKPGIGETTRVLLRRRPAMVLYDPGAAHRLAHIQVLAEDRGVPMVARPGMPYACCGVIEAAAGNVQ